MKVLDYIMVILILGTGLFMPLGLNTYMHYAIIIECSSALIVMAISALSIKRTIKATNFARPNETLIKIHFFNLLGYIILETAASILSLEVKNLSESGTDGN